MASNALEESKANVPTTLTENENPETPVNPKQLKKKMTSIYLEPIEEEDTGMKDKTAGGN